MKDILKPIALMSAVLIIAVLFQTRDPLNAAAEAYARDVRIVMRSTMTVRGLTIPRDGVAYNLMTDQTTTRMRYSYVYVENEETTFDLFCAERSNVTTTGALRGKKILPAGWWEWTIPDGVDWYCACGGATPCAAVVGWGR